MSTRATPLAFGMWQFALPGTDALWLHWDGPGTGLYLACNKAMRPIEHESASGIYPTRRQAQAAADRFIASAEPI